MKLIKRIFYIIFGLLIASAVSLVGLILYSEYSGRQLWKSFGEETADAGFPEEESRLAYDENGNLAELPGSSQPIATEAAAQSDFSTGNPENNISADGTDVSNMGTTNMDISGEDVSNTDTTVENPGQETAPAEEDYTGSQIEQLYIMDMGSALFHLPDCPYASNIAVDKRAERSTTSEKILNAGYKPCTNCNP